LFPSIGSFQTVLPTKRSLQLQNLPLSLPNPHLQGPATLVLPLLGSLALAALVSTLLLWASSDRRSQQISQISTPIQSAYFYPFLVFNKLICKNTKYFSCRAPLQHE